MIVFLQGTFLYIVNFFQQVEVAGDFFILNCCKLTHTDSQFIPHECCLSDVMQKLLPWQRDVTTSPLYSLKN